MQALEYFCNVRNNNEKVRIQNSVLSNACYNMEIFSFPNNYAHVIIAAFAQAGSGPTQLWLRSTPAILSLFTSRGAVKTHLTANRQHLRRTRQKYKDYRVPY